MYNVDDISMFLDRETSIGWDGNVPRNDVERENAAVNYAMAIDKYRENRFETQPDIKVFDDETLCQ